MKKILGLIAIGSIGLVGCTKIEYVDKIIEIESNTYHDDYNQMLSFRASQIEAGILFISYNYYDTGVVSKLMTEDLIIYSRAIFIEMNDVNDTWFTEAATTIQAITPEDALDNWSGSMHKSIGKSSENLTWIYMEDKYNTTAEWTHGITISVNSVTPEEQ